MSGTFYTDLGVRPALGRLIDKEDDRVGDSVAVISYAWWELRGNSERGWRKCSR